MSAQPDLWSDDKLAKAKEFLGSAPNLTTAKRQKLESMVAEQESLRSVTVLDDHEMEGPSAEQMDELLGVRRDAGPPPPPGRPITHDLEGNPLGEATPEHTGRSFLSSLVDAAGFGVGEFAGAKAAQAAAGALQGEDAWAGIGPEQRRAMEEAGHIPGPLNAETLMAQNAVARAQAPGTAMVGGALGSIMGGPGRVGAKAVGRLGGMGLGKALGRGAAYGATESGALGALSRAMHGQMGPESQPTMGLPPVVVDALLGGAGGLVGGALGKLLDPETAGARVKGLRGGTLGSDRATIERGKALAEVERVAGRPMTKTFSGSGLDDDVGLESTLREAIDRGMTPAATAARDVAPGLVGRMDDRQREMRELANSLKFEGNVRPESLAATLSELADLDSNLAFGNAKEYRAALEGLMRRGPGLPGDVLEGKQLVAKELYEANLPVSPFLRPLTPGPQVFDEAGRVANIGEVKRRIPKPKRGDPGGERPVMIRRYEPRVVDTRDEVLGPPDLESLTPEQIQEQIGLIDTLAGYGGGKIPDATMKRLSAAAREDSSQLDGYRAAKEQQARALSSFEDDAAELGLARNQPLATLHESEGGRLLDPNAVRQVEGRLRNFGTQQGGEGMREAVERMASPEELRRLEVAKATDTYFRLKTGLALAQNVSADITAAPPRLTKFQRIGFLVDSIDFRLDPHWRKIAARGVTASPEAMKTWWALPVAVRKLANGMVGRVTSPGLGAAGSAAGALRNEQRNTGPHAPPVSHKALAAGMMIAEGGPSEHDQIDLRRLDPADGVDDHHPLQ